MEHLRIVFDVSCLKKRLRHDSVPFFLEYLLNFASSNVDENGTSRHVINFYLGMVQSADVFQNMDMKFGFTTSRGGWSLIAFHFLRSWNQWGLDGLPDDEKRENNQRLHAALWCLGFSATPWTSWDLLILPMFPWVQYGSNPRPTRANWLESLSFDIKKGWVSAKSQHI